MEEKRPLIEFKTVYHSRYFDVMVDTTTDVCYIMTKNDVGIPAVQVMITPEGKPRTLHYVENEIRKLEQKNQEELMKCCVRDPSTFMPTPKEEQRRWHFPFL